MLKDGLNTYGPIISVHLCIEVTKDECGTVQSSGPDYGLQLVVEVLSGLEVVVGATVRRVRGNQREHATFDSYSKRC